MKNHSSSFSGLSRSYSTPLWPRLMYFTHKRGRANVWYKLLDYAYGPVDLLCAYIHVYVRAVHVHKTDRVGNQLLCRLTGMYYNYYAYPCQSSHLIWSQLTQAVSCKIFHSCHNLSWFTTLRTSERRCVRTWDLTTVTLKLTEYELI